MGPEAHRTTAQLNAMARDLEARFGSAVLAGFSTSLTDDDRKYLDVCGELYARGEYGRKSCSEEP